jgi:hypothetical protein
MWASHDETAFVRCLFPGVQRAWTNIVQFRIARFPPDFAGALARLMANTQGIDMGFRIRNESG